MQLRSAIASAATVAAAALVRDTDMGSQAATVAALQGTAAAVSALSLESAGLNLVACYDAGIAAARPLQVCPLECSGGIAYQSRCACTVFIASVYDDPFAFNSTTGLSSWISTGLSRFACGPPTTR